jgi:stage II sporulation protein D
MRLFRLVLLLAALAPAPTASAGTLFLLDGRGWGHGVGMSQWGAEGAARHGWDYERILAHYYPGTKLEVWHPRPVRVLLGDGVAKARIGSKAPFLVVDRKGTKVRLAHGIVLDHRLLVGRKRLVPPLRFRAGAQPLAYDLQGYRGDLVVKRAGGVLLVVNEVPLDRYLRGVVPWEVPTRWHAGAYRAQAVAARTYALATLHPNEDYDLLPDTRDQMYGGIRAERDETNLAIGATAGRVLTYGGRAIVSYYFSTSGGRTSAIQDAWPSARPVPYLVAVDDPFDYYSPHHAWPTQALTPEALARKLGVGGIRDAVVVPNPSRRAAALRVRTDAGWRSFPALSIREKLGLGSTDFQVRALTLEDAPGRAVYGEDVELSGWIRGLGKARLQIAHGSEWRVLAHLRPSSNGRFAVSVPALASTRYRLAYNGFAGPEVALSVAPRVDVKADGTMLKVHVTPSLPARVERLTAKQWRPVAAGTGTFERELGPGSYRVAVGGDSRYLSAVSRPVGVH